MPFGSVGWRPFSALSCFSGHSRACHPDVDLTAIRGARTRQCAVCRRCCGAIGNAGWAGHTRGQSRRDGQDGGRGCGQERLCRSVPRATRTIPGGAGKISGTERGSGAAGRRLQSGASAVRRRARGFEKQGCGRTAAEAHQSERRRHNLPRCYAHGITRLPPGMSYKERMEGTAVKLRLRSPDTIARALLRAARCAGVPA